MTKLYERSTYRHEFDVEDEDDGSAIDLSEATVSYVMTSERGKGDTVVEFDETDDAVDVEPDGETGLLVVEVPATDVEEGRLWEELRISFPDDRSAVVYQSEERFHIAATEPPQ